MNENNKIVVCDIDSSLCDSYKRIRRNTLPSWPGSIVSHKAWSREEVFRDTLLPNCLYVLTQLKREGFRIKYMTSRGWKHARRTTTDQLCAWGVPNPQEVSFTNNLSSKVDVLTKDVCDYYVDGFTTGWEGSIGIFHGDIARSIQRNGVSVVVFRNDWLDILEQIRIYEEKLKDARESSVTAEVVGG